MKRVGSNAMVFILVLLLVSPLVGQQAGSAEHGPSGHSFIYTVVPADPSRHLLRIRMKLDPQPELTFQLPVWNALYQVRDFSQFLRSITARDSAGHALPVQTIDKTTWAVSNASELEYEFVADTPGPFGAQLTESHAFLNLAQVLIYPAGWQHGWSCVISFDGLPPGWRVATSMIRFPDDTTKLPNSYMAVNYDALVDSPVEMGTFQESEFEEGRARYRVLVDANPSDYDMKAVVDMARKLATTETEWMRDRPVDRYLFIFHFPRRPAGGGMEHAYSTAIDAPAERVKSDPLSLADITAHEFFHLWNVKRIRPQSLEPVDYTKEQYTRALWFSEGVTSTVADFMRVRAGYLDERGFLTELAADIRNLEARPARLTQSAEESSLDAWLEKYPAYESPQRSVSYYNKGEILGMLLDLQMREASAGKKSLRDLFHWMNEHYAKQGRFFNDSRGVQEAAEAVTGANFNAFFAHYVAGTDALPYDTLFATVGLRLDKQTVVLPDPGFRTFRRGGNVAIVTTVDAGSAAEQAGLRPGDVIQQINGKAARAVPENDVMVLRMGDTVELRVVSGRGAHRVKYKLAGVPTENFALVERQDVKPAQRTRRAAWMRGESE